MTDDEPPRRRSAPQRLWTDPREEDEHTQWLAPKTAISAERPPLREPEPPPPPPDRRLWPLVAVGALIAAIVFGTGVLGASLLRDDDGSGSTAALPAAPGAVAPDARSRAVRQVYASASPSVVSVRVRDGGATGSGTGFVIDSDGTIVTNAHVVAGASQVQVRFEDSGDGVDARVLGSDPSSDLAVLRVDSSRTRNIRPLALADSDSVKAGDLAVAIGYPLGLDRTVTAGIVSGVGRAIKAPNGFSIDKVIQTDAPINPGNSGGPLLDAAGRVIGVNSQIATAGGGGGNVGIGFAVPSNTVRQVVPRLRSGATISRPYLGVSSIGSTVGQGAVVADVVSGGPADRGGMLVGDTIRAVGGKPIQAPEDIAAAIEGRQPGDEIDIEVQRAGSQRTLRVTLGTRPENAPSLRTGP
ncbi:MAG TPA: trypsin-like peptidase domain-containing protein [Solirubrobacteraceae bacterium]|nr:trypsin-like peptidase domain-containing protein [Solirubrobacteraceae bacterium]